MLFQKINKVRDALLTVSSNVGHYESLNKDDQYIVWAEDGEGESLHVNDGKKEQVIQGTVDYYTKIDEDSNVDAIQDALSEADISYELNSVQYEDETGYIHYEWVWEVS